MVNYLKQLFINTWSDAEKFSIENHSTYKKNFINKSTILILVYIAFGLSVVKYFGNIDSIAVYIVSKKPGKFGTWFISYFYGSDIGIFHKKIWWVFSIVFIYMIIPVFIIKLGFKKSLKDYGIRFSGIYKDYPLYLIMLLIMVPIVYIASSTLSFQDRYPMYQPQKLQLIPTFIWWQIAYFIQFVALEFFFRGFILHGLKFRFGFYSIFISTVPYCMIHFGKPFAETISAIIAGIVLGTLSLKSRSIILGIIIHYSIAITMDLFALYREGIL